uniref:Phosphatidylinositol-3,4,5-trisphosphate 3-phosphatase n=1 Tax=Zooxanthella nutricula TaxID=1333877 RepID=A0A7S2QJX3_9DINO
MTVFTCRVLGWKFFLVSSEVTTHFVTVSVWGHVLYLALRIFTGDEHDKLNAALIVALAGVWLILQARKEAKESGTKIFLGLTFCAWQVLVVWGYLFVLVMVLVRIWRTYAAARDLGRRLVSQKRRRFVDAKAGVDLDLSYITRHIIAMGWPTENIAEQQLRNPMDQVQRFLTKRHRGSHKVYNLCAERVYVNRCFDYEFHQVRFPDHNVCKLCDIVFLCRDVEDYLRQPGGRRVVVVHCKAGKGRTGMIVSCVLLHLRWCLRASDALACFGRRRTYNGRGVTIPSQIRFVHHYEAVIREGGLRPPRWLHLLRVEVSPRVQEFEELRLQVVHPDRGVIFDTSFPFCSHAPVIEGTFKIVASIGRDTIFQAWLHTAYDATESSRIRSNSAVRAHYCKAGHQMSRIKAYAPRRCARCGQLCGDAGSEDGNEMVFECRLCEPIVWHCQSCARDGIRSRFRGLVLAAKLATFRRASRRAAGQAAPAAERTSFGAAASSARASRAAPLVACPNGHAVKRVSSDRFGAWECLGCGKKSWEAPIGELRVRHRCGKCNFNICGSCYALPPPWRGDAGEDVVTVWAARGRPQPPEVWEHVLTPPMLDGPHKLLYEDKEARGRPGGLDHIVTRLREVRLIFGEASEECDEQEQQHLHEEYDALAADTDNEEDLAILCRGYLVRRLCRCSAPSLRMAELHLDGSLRIAGSNFFGELVLKSTELATHLQEERLTSGAVRAVELNQFAVDLEMAVADASSQEPKRLKRGQQRPGRGVQRPTRTWWIRNPRSQHWEQLQAQDAGEEARWDEAFTDTLRFQTALGPGSGIIFRGFFYVLTANVDPRRLTAVLAQDWRLRLLNMRDDGKLFLYSSELEGDTALCNFGVAAKHGHGLVQLDTMLSAEQQGNYVIFQVPSVRVREGGHRCTWHTLACSPMFFEEFTAQVDAVVLQNNTL